MAPSLILCYNKSNKINSSSSTFTSYVIQSRTYRSPLQLKYAIVIPTAADIFREVFKNWNYAPYSILTALWHLRYVCNIQSIQCTHVSFCDNNIDCLKNNEIYISRMEKYVSFKHSNQRLSNNEILNFGFSKFNYI